MNVSSILRRKGTHVETVHPHVTVEEAARRLTRHRIGSLIVLARGGHLVGVLSERDIVRALCEHGGSALEVRVSELMSPRPEVCKPEDSLRQVMSLMTRRRVRHLPVIAGESLVGIVSIGDVVKGMLEELELEVGVLRDYVRVRP